MKKLLVPFLLIAMIFTACSTEKSQDKEAMQEIEPAVATESRQEIPYDTCKEIQKTITNFFAGYDTGMTLFVRDDDGKLDVSMYVEGIPTQVPFADYANALIIQTQKAAEEYSLEIGQVQVSFSAGEANTMNWRTDDCISGVLLDAYNGNRMMLSGQTVPDLVARYGTMNWFYELNPNEIYSIENPALVNLSPDAIVQNIEVAFQANGVPSDVAYEGGKLEIALWQDGLAESIAGLKDFGVDETYDGWVEFKNGMMTTYDAARDAVDISGGIEIPIVLNVVDENDHNKVFLTIESREVTFDIMAE